jgi:3-phosphoshikimate 1-carboxyvinyltransferase
MPHLPALRDKESDRLQAIAAGLCAAGAGCRVEDDGLVVVGPLPRTPVVPRELPAVADHRIVMALSLLGTVLPGGVRVGNEQAVGKSWPAFFDWLGRAARVTP